MSVIRKINRTFTNNFKTQAFALYQTPKNGGNNNRNKEI